MEDNNEKNLIREEILKAIKSGQVKMRPRWKFVFSGVLFGIGVILITLVLMYFVSFLISALRQSGVLFAPTFGSRGLFEFFGSLPWILVILSFVFLVILEIMVRHYSFGHHKPLLYSVLGIIVIVTAGGIITAPWQTGFLRGDNLPIVGVLYKDLESREFTGIHKERILEIIPNGLIVENSRGATTTVIITQQTSISPGLGIKRGDMIIVFGDADMGYIQAYGIKVVTPDCLFCF